ncbi:MAG: DUF3035 domain-containing protein [Hyphomicrobium sp.]
MQPKILITLATLGTVALGGCSMFDNIGNTKKTAPDEFKIVSHSPLTMPPNADLVRRGRASRVPQETSPADQAKEALSPTLAGRVQQQASAPARSGDASEQSLIAKASKGRRRSQHPQLGQSRHAHDRRQQQELHRQPDLLAGRAAAGHDHRSDQGAAAPARCRGDRQARDRGDADHRAPPARPPRRHLLSAVLLGRRRALFAGVRWRHLRHHCGAVFHGLCQTAYGRGPAPPETFTLANGLQAIVLPSRRAPIVTQLVVYKVGSADETFGKTGIAHFLEHMMFKGTPSVGPTEFSRIVSRNGGRDNAFTDFDQTGYYQTIAADRLELVMRMEADRMANLQIVEKELTPERQVVLEERRMRIDNVPSALLDEKARAELFGERRPYGMPTAGFVGDVEKLGVDDLMAFYRRFYAPNNAVLIMAGDTTSEAVARLAERYYAPIERRAVEARVRPAEGGPQPAAAGEPCRCACRRAHLGSRLSGAFLSCRRDKACLCTAGPVAPVRRQRDQPAVARVGRRQSSRALGRRGATAPRASACRASASTPNPARGATFAEIEQAVAYEMKKVLDGTISAEEVERAQNRLLASAIYAQDSMGSGPRRYGAALSTGNSVADVRCLAAAYRRGSPRGCRGRRASCLARRRRRHLDAHAALKERAHEPARSGTRGPGDSLHCACSACDRYPGSDQPARHQGLAGRGQERACRRSVLFLRGR